MYTIDGISHITFVCHDLEKSAQMFKVIFGAEEVYSSDGKNFSISDEKFMLIGKLWIALMKGEPINRTYNHIAFKIDPRNLPLARKNIEGLGLKILPGRSRSSLEGESLYFYDYDNHLLELHTGSLDTRLNFYNQS